MPEGENVTVTVTLTQRDYASALRALAQSKTTRVGRALFWISIAVLGYFLYTWLTFFDRPLWSAAGRRSGGRFSPATPEVRCANPLGSLVCEKEPRQIRTCKAFNRARRLVLRESARGGNNKLDRFPKDPRNKRSLPPLYAVQLCSDSAETML